jgi:RHS repeat-associated protein
LGSASLETNENGQVISYEEYHPFGTSAYRTAKSNTDLSLKRYRFTNKERDDETGLYYFGVRYYAAWLGRWTSSDPGGFVDGLNLYVYVRNNPVNGVDELGYETDPPPVDPNGNAINVKEGSILERTASGEPTKLKNSDTEATSVKDSWLSYHSPTDGGGWITYTALFSTKTGSFTRYKASDEKLDSDLDEIAAQKEFDIDQKRFMAIFNAKRSASGEVFLNIAIGSLAAATLGVGLGFVVETYGVAAVGKEIAQTAVEETFTAMTGIEVPSVSLRDAKDLVKLIKERPNFISIVGDPGGKINLNHYLKNHKNDDYFDVLVHGSPGKFHYWKNKFFGRGKKVDYNFDADLLANVLVNHTNWDGKMKIRLLSCFSGCDVDGKIGTSSAGRLNKILGVPVIGAMNRVWVKPHGILVGNNGIKSTSYFKTFGK